MGKPVSILSGREKNRLMVDISGRFIAFTMIPAPAGSRNGFRTWPILRRAHFPAGTAGEPSTAGLGERRRRSAPSGAVFTELREGMVLNGGVANVAAFGAFVDVARFRTGWYM